MAGLCLCALGRLGLVWQHVAYWSPLCNGLWTVQNLAQPVPRAGPPNIAGHIVLVPRRGCCHGLVVAYHPCRLLPAEPRRSLVPCAAGYGQCRTWRSQFLELVLPMLRGTRPRLGHLGCIGQAVPGPSHAGLGVVSSCLVCNNNSNDTNSSNKSSQCAVCVFETLLVVFGVAVWCTTERCRPSSSMLQTVVEILDSCLSRVLCHTLWQQQQMHSANWKPCSTSGSEFCTPPLLCPGGLRPPDPPNFTGGLRPPDFPNQYLL